MRKNARRRHLAPNFDSLDRRDVPSSLVAGPALLTPTPGHSAGSGHVGSMHTNIKYVPPAGGAGTSNPTTP